jgi:hypothetical protein
MLLGALQAATTSSSGQVTLALQHTMAGCLGGQAAALTTWEECQQQQQRRR